MSSERPGEETLMDAEKREFFAACFERFYGDVVRYARRRVGPEVAGDVAAEVFLIAWRRVDELVAMKNPLAWLYGVARLTVGNTVRSETRRSALVRKAAGATGAVEVRDPSDGGAIVAALKRLPPQDQEVLRLVAWEGLRGADLAVALGTTVVAARSRRYRARRRLEKALETEHVLTDEGEAHG